MTGPARHACRAFVAGFGKPGLRDLDFGRQVVDWLQQLDWPDEVVVEDLSCSVPLVLHRLQELRPSKVVLLGAVARGVDPPGTLRRYHADLGTAPDEIGDEPLVDIDHTLAVARQWGGLPVDTVVIEVEPAETGFGLGFSEPMAGCLDPILDMVREELADVAGDVGTAPAFDPAALTTDPPPAPGGAASTGVWEPTEAMGALLGYARRHAEARAQSARAPSLLDEPACQAAGVSLAGRVRPWGVCVDSGGDWFDAVPLGDGLVGILVGNVAGRGVEVAATMSDLRAAARAYAVVDGTSPARLVGLLDRLADATGLGRDARLLYLTIRPATGEVRFTSAGASPPLLVEGHPARARYLDGDAGAPLGAAAGVARKEGILHLTATSTLLLCTDGLLEHRTLSRTAGLERFQRSAMAGPAGLEELVDHVLTACTRDLRRDDDICLVGVRVGEGAVSPTPTSHFRQ
jgi:hydrogenase maturation protease